LHRFIALWLVVFFSVFGTAGHAADDWVEKVVAKTQELLSGHGRCVSPSSPYSVYVLNATSGEHMSAKDERWAVNELTSALSAGSWMQVIHGSALPYEAYTRGNSAEGQQQMYDLLAAQSDATVTLFVVPLERLRDVVQAEVIYLARSIENGKTHLTCAGGINVDIPIFDDPIIDDKGIEEIGPGKSICNPTADTLVVTNVTEYATLRSGTSYDEPEVAKAQLGASVDYTGSRRLSKPSKAARCDQRCREKTGNGLDASGESALDRCIRDDVFWLNVRTASGRVGWMSAKYLRYPATGGGAEVPPRGEVRTGIENGCRVILNPHKTALSAAETFVELYYRDLSARRVRCAEKRWLDPPDDLAEMIVEFTSARLSYNELDRSRSGSNRAFVDVVADIGTTDGQQTAWRVTLTLVASRSGWLIEEMNGYQM